MRVGLCRIPRVRLTGSSAPLCSELLRMLHLRNVLLVASLYGLAAFRPKQFYANVDNEFVWIGFLFDSPLTVKICALDADTSKVPFRHDVTGDIDWDPSPNDQAIMLHVHELTFQEFLRIFSLNIEDWKSIPYDRNYDTFTVLYQGHEIILKAVGKPPVPPPQGTRRRDADRDFRRLKDLLLSAGISYESIY
ncbi:hypothetical protein FOZ62_025962 [Perkinsus olseni]|uniref:Uncharacterized protein n=1 Tax=Perkinsus olseni TaxID=32597 RepID=A0A7J6S9M2_PEROL|nr:hypothetical protein FOZ62_025962 [Perkinsus olseni]